MSFITRVYRCPECRAETEKIEERSEESTVQCGPCGVAMFRAPTAATVLRDSQPDGYRRADGWYIAKEAAAIERAAQGLPPEKRAEAKKEAKKLNREAARRGTSKSTDYKD